MPSENHFSDGIFIQMLNNCELVRCFFRNLYVLNV